MPEPATACWRDARRSAALSRPSTRAYAGALPALADPDHVLVTRATNAGTIRVKTRLLCLSTALTVGAVQCDEQGPGALQTVGIRPTSGARRGWTDMSLKIVRFAAAVLVLAAARLLSAHHSVPVNFDQSKEVTIAGVTRPRTRLTCR
jgi:hypothetical protein